MRLHPYYSPQLCWKLNKIKSIFIIKSGDLTDYAMKSELFA